MPIRRRSDFKQALSTLQQLKEKEDEAQRNQRWAQSSSSWWSWQGSWWTPYSYESHHGDEPSTDWTGQLVIQVLGTIPQGTIFLNSFTLLQLDRLQLTAVYCDRRVVWIPHLKCRGNMVQNMWKMATGKSWMNYYSMTTMRIGCEIKARKVELCSSGQHSTIRTPITTCTLAWHCTTQTSMTTCMIAWLRTMRTPLNTSTERHTQFSLSSWSRPHIWLKFESCTSLHLHSHPCVRSLHLDLLSLLPSLPAVPVLLPFPLPHQQEVHGKPVQLR